MADKPTSLVRTEPTKSKKRVAKDGTQRGLHRTITTRRETLLQEVQAAVLAQAGTVNWDPVVMMAVVAEQCRTGYPSVDEKGNPILNERGEQVIIPPNLELAVAAAAKVAPYLHSQLRPKEADSEDSAPDAVDARQRTRDILERAGMPIPEHLQD